MSSYWSSWVLHTIATAAVLLFFSWRGDIAFSDDYASGKQFKAGDAIYQCTVINKLEVKE